MGRALRWPKKELEAPVTKRASQRVSVSGAGGSLDITWSQACHWGTRNQSKGKEEETQDRDGWGLAVFSGTVLHPQLKGTG